jgi:hypothetical protein
MSLQFVSTQNRISFFKIATRMNLDVARCITVLKFHFTASVHESRVHQHSGKIKAS